MTHDERRLLLVMAAFQSAQLAALGDEASEAEIDELAKRIADANPGSMSPEPAALGGQENDDAG